jgi:hypothetical protein
MSTGSTTKQVRARCGPPQQAAPTINSEPGSRLNGKFAYHFPTAESEGIHRRRTRIVGNPIGGTRICGIHRIGGTRIGSTRISGTRIGSTRIGGIHRIGGTRIGGAIGVGTICGTIVGAFSGGTEGECLDCCGPTGRLFGLLWRG